MNEKCYLLRDLTKNTWIGIDGKDVTKPFGTDSLWLAYKFTISQAKKYRDEYGNKKWSLHELTLKTTCIEC